MAKSYNPFKMWGAWVGLGFIILLIIFGMLFTETLAHYKQNKITGCSPDCITTDCDEYGCRIDSLCVDKCVNTLGTMFLDGISKITTPLFYTFAFIPLGIVSLLGLCHGEFCSDTSPFITIPLYLLEGIFLLSLGFLLGWGIHALIRKIRG